MNARKEPRPLAESYVFVAPDTGRGVMKAAFLVSLAAFCVGATLSVSQRHRSAMVVTAVAAALLVILWSLMQTKIPQRVTVRGSSIQIRRDGRVDQFDLEDPAVDIRVKDGEIAFAHYMDRWVSVRSRDVDWPVFTDVVMYYQNKADRNAEERDKRFSS